MNFLEKKFPLPLFVKDAFGHYWSRSPPTKLRHAFHFGVGMKQPFRPFLLQGLSKVFTEFE